MANNFKQLQDSIEKAVVEYATMGGLAVEVGLPDDRIHPSGLTLAELGASHEFGTHGKPERSFLRASMLDGKADIKKTMEILAKKSANGESAEQLMEQFALWGQGLVQEFIRDGKVAPPTISGDPSKTTLIDNADMVQGVIGVVVSD